MDADVKKELDLRLAKGEISIDEYNSLLKQIQKSNNPTSSKISGLKTIKDSMLEGYESFSSSESIASIKSNLISAKNSIFGNYENIAPTDSQPYKIKRNLILLKASLSYRGIFHDYDTISSLSLISEKSTINLLTTNIIKLNIYFDNREKITAKSTNPVFEGPKFRSIYNAFFFLSKITFESRRNKLILDFEKRGFIERDGVRIYNDSRIQKGGTVINLKTAGKNNNIQIGKSFDLSYKFNYNNPNKIIIGEDGTGIMSKRITFNLISDRDIILPLIFLLSEQTDE